MLSIIIPAYNAALYLKRGVEAIMAARTDGSQIEIIIVENGSTDQTTQEAQKLVNQYTNIYLYHSDKGVSNARNLGIEKANGEYIAFLDADDYYTTSGLSKMLKDISLQDEAGQTLGTELTTKADQFTKIDMFAYGHEAGENQRPVAEKTIVYAGTEANKKAGVSVEDARAMMIANPTKYMQAWAKIFRKSIIDAYNIRFDTTMSLSEDSDFTIKYTKYCKGICLQPEIVYHYSIDNVSTMRGKAKGDKLVRFTDAMQKTAKAIEEQNETEVIKRAFDKYILMNLNIAMVRDVYCVTSELTRAQKRTKLKQTAHIEIFANAIRHTKAKECLSPRMVPVLAMKLRCYFIAELVYVLRAKQVAKREQ